MQTASESFSYDQADVLVVSDAAGINGTNMAGLGFMLLDPDTRRVLAEGRMTVTGINSSDEAECLAAQYALLEAVAYGSHHPILWTDFDNIPQHLMNATNNTNMDMIQDALQEFDSWCVRSVDRSELERANSLAQSAYHDAQNTSGE